MIVYVVEEPRESCWGYYCEDTEVVGVYESKKKALAKVKEMEKINKLVNNAYISHDELLLIKEELRLANLLKNIKNIAHLRQELVV